MFYSGHELFQSVIDEMLRITTTDPFFDVMEIFVTLEESQKYENIQSRSVITIARNLHKIGVLSHLNPHNILRYSIINRPYLQYLRNYPPVSWLTFSELLYYNERNEIEHHIYVLLDIGCNNIHEIIKRCANDLGYTIDVVATILNWMISEDEWVMVKDDGITIYLKE